MSGSLSRSVSLSPVDAVGGSIPSGIPPGSPPSMPAYVKTNNSSRIPDLSVSPLKIFVLAKKKINDIFFDIKEYVNDSHKFLEGLGEENEVASREQAQALRNYTKKIVGIEEVLKRDHMKVAFFGRTSNGKSTVVNAMLRDKILPSGLGHTTNCFLQVEGSDTNEAYLLTDDSKEPKNVKSVAQLAHALNAESLVESARVRIMWPKEKCPLLRDDVVLVDSPGIDVSPNLDEWIDSYCLDADVFILVANAESTLMQTEKNFFHKVSERLSKPNIFILNNRWDASASEPEYLEGVRKQHMDRNIAFLADELKVVSRQQAEDRVFFVSAKEVLQARLKQQQGLPPHAGALAEGFQNRYFEFQDFERKFEECLSKSAVKTKFEQHAQRGKTIINDIRTLMNSIHNTASSLRQDKFNLRKEQWDRQEFTQQQLELLTEEVKLKIGQLVEQVETRVASALSEEIRRLANLVNDFERPFHPDSLVLSVYKKELHSHVEQGLGSNLRMKLSSTLALTVERAQKDMVERMSSLLPAEHKQHMINILPRHNFEVLYRLQCESLCSDFQEDLDFRFSLGLMSLVKRFLGPKGSKMVLGNGTDSIPRPMHSSPQTPSNEMAPVSLPPADYLAIVQKMSMISPSSSTAIGILTIGGVVSLAQRLFLDEIAKGLSRFDYQLVRTVGWRVIAVTFGLYGVLYMYERITWTNKAKERTFKRQYVDHATRKLRLIVDLTSANCSHQVQQELSSTYARLCHLVDDVVSEMQGDIKNLDQEVEKLEVSANTAKILRNKAGYLSSELETFSQQYLHYDES